MKEQTQLDIGGRIAQPISMVIFYWGVACVLGSFALCAYNVVLLPLQFMR